jgi:hypothetical protein
MGDPNNLKICRDKVTGRTTEIGDTIPSKTRFFAVPRLTLGPAQ